MDKDQIIIEKIDELDTRLSGKIDQLDGRMANMELDVSGLKIDVSDLKTDVSGLKSDTSDIRNILEGMSTILQRLDQERIFTVEWVKRIETEVNRHTQELVLVKQRLNIT